MKRLWLLSTFCLFFLTAYSPEKIEKSLHTSSFFSLVKLSIKQQKKPKLSQEDINSICDKLDTTIYNCKDGTQVIKCYFDAKNIIYIHYFPKRLSNGNYQFFQNLKPSYEIDYKEDNSVVIPIYINDSQLSRFSISVKYSISENNIKVNNITFTLFHKEDKEFNKMYTKLNYNEQETYRLSLAPNKNLKGKRLSKFLRACFYNGNSYVLEELYKLLPNDDLESKFRIELAYSFYKDSTIPFSHENPYQPEVFYNESCKNFPQMNTLTMILESLQTNNSLEKLGAKQIESNFDWESVYQISNFHDYYKSLEKDERVLEVYKLDMDHDGLMEILVVFAGGTLGNLFWEVLHLDASGAITDTNSGSGMYKLSLYNFQGEYFFLTEIRESYDKEFLGWEVYALNQSTVMYRADIRFEKTGSKIIFTDKYTKKNSFYELDWDDDYVIDDYIDIYKRYEYKTIGTEIKPDKEILTLFYGSENAEEYDQRGVYGIFDFNNDNINDWTKVYMFLPTNRHQYYCDYLFVDGKSKQQLDFSNLTGNDILRCIIPYKQEDKNYFICVLSGYGTYILKLIEIKDIQIIELRSWVVSVTRRILVQVSENNKTRHTSF